MYAVGETQYLSQEQRRNLYVEGVRLLKKYRQISVFQFCKITGITEMQARQTLSWMVRKGVAKQVGDFKGLQAVTLAQSKSYTYDMSLSIAMNLAISLMEEKGELANIDTMFAQRNREPYTLFMELDGEFYNVMYIKQGREKYAALYLNQLPLEEMGLKNLAIMEDISKRKEFSEGEIDFFYAVDNNGKVELYDN